VTHPLELSAKSFGKRAAVGCNRSEATPTVQRARATASDTCAELILNHIMHLCLLVEPRTRMLDECVPAVPLRLQLSQGPGRLSRQCPVTNAPTSTERQPVHNTTQTRQQTALLQMPQTGCTHKKPYSHTVQSALEQMAKCHDCRITTLHGQSWATLPSWQACRNKEILLAPQHTLPCPCLASMPIPLTLPCHGYF